MFLTIYDMQKLLLLQELTDNDFAISSIPTINKELVAAMSINYCPVKYHQPRSQSVD